MKRRQYIAPELKIVEMDHKESLMDGSPAGITSSRNSYGDATTDTWN